MKESQIPKLQAIIEATFEMEKADPKFNEIDTASAVLCSVVACAEDSGVTIEQAIDNLFLLLEKDYSQN